MRVHALDDPFCVNARLRKTDAGRATRALMPHLQLEKRYWSMGCLMAGVDEAGRGSIAGPLVAAAVVLGPHTDLSGFWTRVKDSKKLSPAVRTRLAQCIAEAVLGHAWGVVSAQEIDRMGINCANQLAMERAVLDLSGSVQAVVADWIGTWPLRLDPLHPAPEQTRVAKGDAQHVSVAAASILAKVRKDECMRELDRRFPQFGFKTNNGYLTRTHAAVLAAQGPCVEHRFAFKPLADRFQRTDGRA